MFHQTRCKRTMSTETLMQCKIVHVLKKDKNILNNFVSNNYSRLPKRKTMKRASLDDLDKVFSKKQTQGVPISQSMLVQKVKCFNDTLGFSVDFKSCFKSWHSICKLSVQGEKLSRDSAVATKFRKVSWLF